MNNVQTILRYYSGKVIIAEQLSKKFGGFGDRYMYFDDKQFHRTKMINAMVAEAVTDIVAICDADVIVPQDKIDEAVQMIASGEADIVYPYNNFIKLNERYSKHVMETLDVSKYENERGVHSVGGVFFVNKNKYIESGGENERFITWGYEDVERYRRFEKLGLAIKRLEGNLYHLYHHVGPNSSPINPHMITNRHELDKVSSMDKEALQEYIKTW
jgi:predicted glycosyltransferase involved in capsule biosynthesis